MRVLVAGIILLSLRPVMLAQNSSFNVDRLVVYKRERKLVLLSQGKEVRSYKVALGSEPVGPKSRQGDHRTPEGVYVLDSRNPNSRFYKAFHISYKTREIPQPPGNWASVRAETSCFTGFRKSMHGWGKPTLCTIGQTGASRLRMKKWTKFGNWFALALPSKSSPEPEVELFLAKRIGLILQTDAGGAPAPHRLHLLASFAEFHGYFQLFLAPENSHFDGVPSAVPIHDLC